MIGLMIGAVATGVAALDVLVVVAMRANARAMTRKDKKS